MNVMKINFGQPQTNFKSTYPVVHLIYEQGASKASFAAGKTKKMIHNRFIRILTGSGEKKRMIPFNQKIRAYIARIDKRDYSAYLDRPNEIRTFNDESRRVINRYTPDIYIASGPDSYDVDNLGRKIGKAKHEAKETTGSVYNEKSLEKIQKYYQDGIDLVNEDHRRLKDDNGRNLILYTYSVIKRDAFGVPKDFGITHVEFRPEGDIL